MGYFAAGDDPAGKLTGEWKDTTNPATKNHVVRLAIGTSRQFEYLHSANDLPIGILQRTGTYHQELEAATEGIVICVNSKAGTIEIGDPVIYDHTNSGGTSGKVKSALDSFNMAEVDGTATNAAFYSFTDVALTPPRPHTLWTGTAGAGMFILDGADGTTIYTSAGNNFVAAKVYYMIDQPVIGFALDKANSPQDLLRVKLARQWDIKSISTW